MKHIFILIALLFMAGLYAQSADSLLFALPQNMDPVFDYYSYNFLGTQSMGRGHTGVGSSGTEEVILVNPAAYKAIKPSLYLEILIKPPSNSNIYPGENEFSSPVPFGMVALGGKLKSKFTWGAALSMPKSIRFSSMDVELNQGGDLHSRYPQYSLHQATANVAFHHGAYNLGLNLHAQLHYIDDLAVLRSFASIREYKLTLRPQAGFLYDKDAWSVGLSYTPQSKLKWEMDLIDFDSKLPALASIGGKIQNKQDSYHAQLDWQGNSSLEAKYKDRISIKAGYETTRKELDYRIGYIYRSQAYSGFYKIPNANVAHADTSIWWQEVPKGGYIKDNSQHFITAGLSRRFKFGSFDLGFIYQIIGAEPMSQIGLSSTLFLDVFRRKSRLLAK